MTSKDIEKALKLCGSKSPDCDSCPYADERVCSDLLCSDAYMYIQALKAEIADLKKSKQ